MQNIDICPPSESWYSKSVSRHLNTTRRKEKWNSRLCFRGLSSISFSSSFSGLVLQPAFPLLEYQKPSTIVVLNRAFPPFGTTRHPKRGIGKMDYTTRPLKGASAGWIIQRAFLQHHRGNELVYAEGCVDTEEQDALETRQLAAEERRDGQDDHDAEGDRNVDDKR